MRLGQNDVAILRELLGWAYGVFPRGSLQVSTKDIAQKTGLHRNTVQRRIQALQEGGVVDGYLFEPHPAPLGLVRAGHRFDGVRGTDVPTMAKVLQDFPWVSLAALHMDSCFLHTWHEAPDAVAGDIAALAEALQAQDVVFSFRSDHWPSGPADGLVLGDLDRRVLLALRRGPRRSVEQVARDTNGSRRTVARRIDRLAAAGAGAMLPVFRPGRIEGRMIVIFDGPARPGAAQAVQEVFPERIMGPVVAGPRVMAMVPVTGMDEAARCQERAEAAEALRGMDMRFLRDMLFPEACDDWLAARVQIAPPRAAQA